MFGSRPGGQATRTVPLGSAIASAATTAAASAAATIDSHCSWTARPTGVTRKPRVDRSIRRAPYRSSSLATRLLSDDLVTCSARAAELNPPCCTTLANAKRSLSSCTGKPLLFSFGNGTFSIAYLVAILLPVQIARVKHPAPPSWGTLPRLDAGTNKSIQKQVTN